MIGINGNAHAIIKAFKTQAHKEHWSKEEIQSVVDEAMSDTYSHLLSTIEKYYKPKNN